MFYLPLSYESCSLNLFKRIRHWPYPIWLDSCRDQNTTGRYDILTAQPQWRLIHQNNCFYLHQENKISQIIEPNLFKIIIETFNAWCSLYSVDLKSSDEATPLPGLFGYLGYKFNHSIEKIISTKTQDIPLPDAYLGFYPWCLVVDHDKKSTLLISLLDNDSTQTIYQQLQQPLIEPCIEKIAEQDFSLTRAYQANLTQAEYFSAFNKIKNYLQQGDCYQINFAQRFQASYVGDPFFAYQRNRQTMPAPYSAFIQLPEGSILCHSPEHFITVNHQQVKTSPIKGTAAKQSDHHLDQQVQKKLLASEKNRAENIMIVDLLRNDLGKVCAANSIQVEELCALKTFSHLHHLISTVSGTLPSNTSALNLLQACFPGGSITGAPKHRAMQIIDELEPHRRSVYCGSIIHFGINQGLNSNITIRTQVACDHQIYAWAGGGIVADSTAEEEYEESFIKIRPLLIN